MVRTCAAAAVLLMFSCHRLQMTKIEREVYDMGGGDPRGASYESLKAWFLERPQFAAHIADECGGTLHTLGYPDTPTGRVCASAMFARFFAARKADRDGVGW
jgi:hypothetical protein